MKKDIYKSLHTFSLSKYISSIFVRKKLRTVIFGNFGAMNLGDEAILSGQLEDLRSSKNIHTVVVARNPKEIKRLHNVRSVSLLNLLGILYEIMKSNFVIVGGGGLICKSDRGLIGILYQMYMLFVYFLLPRLFGKKIYTVGIGVYDNTNPLILKIAAGLLKYSEIITVRDVHSLDLLQRLHIPAKIYKDSSFLMKLTPKQITIKDPYFISKYDPKKKNIGIALLKPENHIYEQKIIDGILHVAKKHTRPVIWIYAVDTQGNYFNDYEYAKLIKQKLGKYKSLISSVHIIPKNWDPNKFFSSFKLMDFFITMRLHASIFAYRNKVDFVSIPYDVKCESFIESIGKKNKILFLIANTAVNKNNKGLISPATYALGRFITQVRRILYLTFGFVDTLRSKPTNAISVLSYHSVNEDNWRFSIDTEVLKKQLLFLLEEYEFISLQDLEGYIYKKREIKKPAIVLTFDDGYKDILKMRSFIKEHNIKPALFILSDNKNANNKELNTKRAFLAKKDILHLIHDGWQIGSHTATHPNLSSLGKSEIAREVTESKKKLEKDLGIQIKYFAYPRGKYNNTVLYFVRKAGYALGLTMDDGVITTSTNPLLIPRVGVDRTHGFAEFKKLMSPLNIDFRRSIKASFIGRYI
jgi:polysaccharide pyruvyl transferase WcaK-like protein/peptidoglycan/xylan/chitin deacetylase (PgdA/CDA1 family)